MWLIAESGSTKTDWVLLTDADEVKEKFQTAGINPTFLKEDGIAGVLKREFPVNINSSEIREVYFFGAGVSSERLEEIARRGITSVFRRAKVYVDHDLTACAYACYEGDPCICCIIGTGSNSVFFDGKKLRKEVPSLAFILGDEASGVYFSKELLRAYFYKQLPTDLRSSFVEAYGNLDKDELISRVYEQDNPNRYLASFMPFVIENKDHPFFHEIILKGIREFLSIHVLCYPEAKDVKVHFVGSVAKLLKKEIEEVGREMGLSMGQYLTRPISHLKAYIMSHKSQLLPREN